MELVIVGGILLAAAYAWTRRPARGDDMVVLRPDVTSGQITNRRAGVASLDLDANQYMAFMSDPSYQRVGSEEPEKRISPYY